MKKSQEKINDCLRKKLGIIFGKKKDSPKRYGEIKFSKKIIIGRKFYFIILKGK